MKRSDHPAAPIGSAASLAPDAACPERHNLLARLTQAFDDYSAAVRESRERGSLTRDDRTEATGARCAQVWNELREHQDKHGCWRQRESHK